MTNYSLNAQVAIIFDDLTEFFVMQSGIDALIKHGIALEIYVPSGGAYSQQLLDDTANKICELGYSVLRKAAGKRKYKILLEPYPLDILIKIEHEFRLKYMYGACVTKPDPVYLPNWNLLYDGIITYSKRESEIHSVYAQTFTVGYLRYQNFHKETHSGKPNLLYLPTYGNISSVDNLSQAFAELKAKYHIIIKSHHAIQYRPDQQVQFGALEECADEFFDSTVPLDNLLARADIVLTDNSGAIFDAIYAGVPVAIFSDKLNERKLPGINTYQYKLVAAGIIPCTSVLSELDAVLSQAFELQERQAELRTDFILDQSDLTIGFVQVIQQYLSLNRTESDYFGVHDILHKQWREGQIGIAKASDLQLRLNSYKQHASNLEQELADMRASTSWRLTKPLRNLADKLRSNRA